MFYWSDEKNLDWNMCTNKWVHFIMYKLYLDKVDLKAQEEPLLSVAKTLSSQCRGARVRSLIGEARAYMPQLRVQMPQLKDLICSN